MATVAVNATSYLGQARFFEGAIRAALPIDLHSVDDLIPNKAIGCCVVASDLISANLLLHSRPLTRNYHSAYFSLGHSL